VPASNAAVGGFEHEVTRFQLHILASLKVKPDGLRISARRNLKVVFQLSLLAVIDEIDTGYTCSYRTRANCGTLRCHFAASFPMK